MLDSLTFLVKIIRNRAGNATFLYTISLYFMRNVAEFQVKNEKGKSSESRVNGVWERPFYTSRKAPRRIPERRPAGRRYDSDGIAWKAPDRSFCNRRTRLLSDTYNRDTSAWKPLHHLEDSIWVPKRLRRPVCQAFFPWNTMPWAPGARLRRPAGKHPGLFRRLGQGFLQRNGAVRFFKLMDSCFPE